MTAFKQRLWTLLKSPASVTLIVSLVLLTAIILFIGNLRSFNSDDLYWQQVVRTWAPFSGETLYLATKDTFVQLIPFFWLMEHLFSPSRGLLLAEVLILTLSAFVMIYMTALYFLKKLKIKPTYIVLLPFIWVATFGYPMVQNYLNADWRTFEFGISFLTFLLAAAICMDDFNPLKSLRNKILSALAVIYIGIVAFSDPYYVYFTLAPIGIFAVFLFALKKIDRAKLIIIGSGLVLAMVISVLTGFFLEKSGVITVTETPSIFVGFESIVTNIIASLHGFLIVFESNFFGRPVKSLATIGYAINALALGFILYYAFKQRTMFRLQVARKLPQPQLWVGFFLLVVITLFITYTSSTLAMATNYRFYILVVFCLITFLVLTLGLMKKGSLIRNIISGVLIVATLFNIAHIFFTDYIKAQGEVAANTGNAVNYKIIDDIKEANLTKGYASYWQGNVNTYLSEGNIVFLPTICQAGVTKPFKWLIDGTQYYKPADKTFYLIDPDIPTPPVCTKKEIIKQFGEPERTFKIDDKTVLVYNYDIGTKMDQNWLAR